MKCVKRFINIFKYIKNIYLMTFNMNHITTILIWICIPYTIYTSHYSLLITELPIATSSILFHYRFDIKNIRNIDILCSCAAWTHHMTVWYIYGTNNLPCRFYGSTPFIYIIAQSFWAYDYKFISNTIHSFIHIAIILGTLSLNASM